VEGSITPLPQMKIKPKKSPKPNQILLVGLFSRQGGTVTKSTKGWPIPFLTVFSLLEFERKQLTIEALIVIKMY
jgi:hypothetical protein